LININEIELTGFSKLKEKYFNAGGVLVFDVFRIEKNYLGQEPNDEYLNHLMTARQTLEGAHYQANFHWNKVANKYNRNSLPILKTNHTELSNSGKNISVEEFLGPFYDLNITKPIIRGVSNGTMNCYFYPDSNERIEESLKIQSRIDDFEERFKKADDSGTGFIYALMEPPYSIRIGNNIQEKGDFVMQFMNEIFDDLNQLIIYKWSTDSSSIFDAGKEWWGCYFWTVFNPKKKIYIGILGSSTD